MDGRTLYANADIRRVIQRAADEWMVVKIQYVSGDGRQTTREIEPVIANATGVDAWCRLRRDERHFVFSRIRWAKATGERYADVVDLEPDLDAGLDADLDAGEEDLLDLR